MALNSVAKTFYFLVSTKPEQYFINIFPSCDLLIDFLIRAGVVLHEDLGVEGSYRMVMVWKMVKA